MKGKKIGIIILLLIGIFGLSTQAQTNKKYEYRIRAGFNIGGTSPIPLPAEIRKIESYSPTMLFSVEGNVMRWFSPKWALSTGLRFETKGMNAGARVKNYQMTMMIENGDMTGDGPLYRTNPYPCAKRIYHTPYFGRTPALATLGNQIRPLFFIPY